MKQNFIKIIKYIFPKYICPSNVPEKLDCTLMCYSIQKIASDHSIKECRLRNHRPLVNSFSTKQSTMHQF